MRVPSALFNILFIFLYSLARPGYIRNAKVMAEKKDFKAEVAKFEKRRLDIIKTEQHIKNLAARLMPGLKILGRHECVADTLAKHCAEYEKDFTLDHALELTIRFTAGAHTTLDEAVLDKSIIDRAVAAVL